MRRSFFAVVAIANFTVACASSSTVPASTAPAAVSPGALLPPVGYRPEFGTMWTFDAPPLEYWQRTYGFAPDQAWLDHVRTASVRLSNCSSSFVSADGLVLTNQHCVRDCAVDVSPPDTNYIQTGFVARTLREEKKCPGMYVDELVSIENVTQRVMSALTAATPEAQAPQRARVIGQIETECAAQAKLTCQVVSLYHGGIYSVYRYKRYNDLRLAFSPEDPVAAFGGDYDNFTYPRHDMDVGFLRAYDGDKPYTPGNFLRWSASGPAEG
ncbi:MAG TPA: S46 family peptidase, partial [Gemmatimonadaceae bacterium]